MEDCPRGDPGEERNEIKSKFWARTVHYFDTKPLVVNYENVAFFDVFNASLTSKLAG